MCGCEGYGFQANKSRKRYHFFGNWSILVEENWELTVKKLKSANLSLLTTQQKKR